MREALISTTDTTPTDEQDVLDLSRTRNRRRSSAADISDPVAVPSGVATIRSQRIGSVSPEGGKMPGYESPASPFAPPLVVGGGRRASVLGLIM